MRIDVPNGIQIIDDIRSQPGVDTLEGRIGPLIYGAGSKSHYIELPPGGFCEEHPHSTESIIYTVSGQWVLCSQGKRFHMRAGNLFWFGPDVATGYEVPFADPAYILIFKGERGEGGPEQMIEYLIGMGQRLEASNRKGTPFSFAELPKGHPARVFAASLPDSIA